MVRVAYLEIQVLIRSLWCRLQYYSWLCAFLRFAQPSRSFPLFPRFSDLAVDVYYIGGGYGVPVGSEYLGCMRDEKTPKSARAISDGMLRCKGTMTVPVNAIYRRNT